MVPQVSSVSRTTGHRALLIGINYVAHPDDSWHRHLPPQLLGAVSNARVIKETLLGACVLDDTALPFPHPLKS